MPSPAGASTAAAWGVAGAAAALRGGGGSSVAGSTPSDAQSGDGIALLAHTSAIPTVTTSRLRHQILMRHTPERDHTSAVARGAAAASSAQTMPPGANSKTEKRKRRDGYAGR